MAIKQLFLLATQLLFLLSSQAAAQEFRMAFSPLQNPHDDLVKRQAGYTPTDGDYCSGSGDTCKSACGPTYQQCSSTDSETHCYDTSIGSHCCNDGTGLSCDKGYYCTFDSSHDTYCCPSGLDLAQCAKSYTLSALFTTPAAKKTSTIASATATSAAGETTTSSSVAAAATTAAPTSSIPSNGTHNGSTSTLSLFQGDATTASSVSGLGAMLVSAALFGFCAMLM